MPQNGEVNGEFGVYKSLCCSAEIVIREGAVFPQCPNHPRYTTTWKPLSDENMTRLTDKKNRSQSPPLSPPMEAAKQQQFVTHIDYGRLLDLARGRIKIERWEQVHLDGCRVCHSVYAYLGQLTTASGENPESEDDAA